MYRILKLFNPFQTSISHRLHKEIQRSITMKVQYPDANFNYDQITLAIQKRNIPVVVLLGWTGCQDKYLKKYSEIYENYGLITARYTAPSDAIYYKSSRMDNCAKGVIDFLHQNKLDHGPIIFHSFSNGGALLYCNILENLMKANQQLQIKGEIFDSAPSGRRAHIYRVFNSVIPGNFLIKYPLSFIAGSLIILYTSFLNMLSFFTNRTYLNLAAIYDYLNNQKNSCPQHCVYSKKDFFYEGIEDFVKSRQQKGVKMTNMCFEDSLHVKHFFTYKSQYLSGINSFLETCLGKSSSQNDLKNKL